MGAGATFEARHTLHCLVAEKAGVGEVGQQGVAHFDIVDLARVGGAGVAMAAGHPDFDDTGAGAGQVRGGRKKRAKSEAMAGAAAKAGFYVFSAQPDQRLAADDTAPLTIDYAYVVNR